MIHLHVHSNFSFLDGASPLERLVERAVELEMPALALTDHHGLYGIVRFLQAADARGIKPIIGTEVAITPTSSIDDAPVAPCHLVLLAKNRQGYANLCRIISKATGAYGPAPVGRRIQPEIAVDDLAPLAGDLIALSGCRYGGCCGSVLAAALSGSSSSLSCIGVPDIERAARVAQHYAQIFGKDNFWIELEHHLLPGDDARNRQLVEVARRMGLGYVITNDVHYAKRDEYRLRDVMVCIQTGTTLDVRRKDEQCPDLRHRNAEYYLKSRDEMRAAFAGLPDEIVESGLDASAYIASCCSTTRSFGGRPGQDDDMPLLATASRPPDVKVPPGETPFSYLYGLCQEGLRDRYRPLSPGVVNRLSYELTIVEQMDLASFFLCVWDIVRFARSCGIRCAGRGSAADSLIAYALGITNVDPLAHNLLFDRFLNPGRAGMPDVDIDFDSRRRDEVIAYVESKYGTEHAAMVANVITYRARSAFRDVAKAMGYPPALIDHVAAILSYSSVGHIREDIQAAGVDAHLDPVIELCEQLAGYPRHLSLHNGGMLITREPLVDVVPLEYATSGVRVCQFNKDDVEALGLIKFDILGLRTLSIIDEAVGLIKDSRGIDPAIDDISLDDKPTYDLICSSKTIGVFQIESPGQWHLLQRTQPQTFADLIIQIALFRPGPLQGGMVNPYIERRADRAPAPAGRGSRAPIPYPHPSLEDALHDTLGVVIFQEQVLQVAHDFAGLSYAEADGFRRAMSHYRTEAEMDACRTSFVESAVRMGRDRVLAEELYQTIAYFSGYGFCRSHAAAFAKTVYQTAYLKAHYPSELLAAILSNEPCCYYPAQTVIEEARKWDIPVLPVDINRSRARYHVESSRSGAPKPSAFPGTNPPAIRIGLMQVKGLSEETAEAIVRARGTRPYRDLTDFWRRATVDCDVATNLVTVGAFDSLGVPRRQLLWRLNEVTRMARRNGSSRRASSEQPSPFLHVVDKVPRRVSTTWSAPPLNLELGIRATPDIPIPNLPSPTDLDLAGLDFMVQDVSARYSVMSFYRRSLRAAGVLSIGDLESLPQGLTVKTAGIIISRQRPPTAKGMAFLVLSDEDSELPVALYPAVYEQARRTLGRSASLVVEGALQRTGHSYSLLAKRLWRLQDIATLDTEPYSLHESRAVYSA